EQLPSGSFRSPWAPGRLGILPELRQRDLQFVAGADGEFGVHLTQVPFDRARGQEQLRADLRIRQAIAGQPGDLLLLRRELVARLDTALSRLLAAGQQVALGAPGVRLP